MSDNDGDKTPKNDNGEGDSKNNPPEGNEPDKGGDDSDNLPEDIQKKLKEYKEQKDHYKEKLDKLENTLADDDGGDGDDGPDESNVDVSTKVERLEFIYNNKDEDITPQDVELLEKLRDEGQSLGEVYEEHKDIVEAKKKSRQAEGKPAEPSGPSGGSSGPTVDGKSYQDIQSMDADEFKKFEEQYNKKRREGSVSV